MGICASCIFDEVRLHIFLIESISAVCNLVVLGSAFVMSRRTAVIQVTSRGTRTVTIVSTIRSSRALSIIVQRIITPYRIPSATTRLIDVKSDNFTRILKKLPVKRLMRTDARDFFLDLQTLVQSGDELNIRMLGSHYLGCWSLRSLELHYRATKISRLMSVISETLRKLWSKKMDIANKFRQTSPVVT